MDGASTPTCPNLNKRLLPGGPRPPGNDGNGGDADVATSRRKRSVALPNRRSGPACRSAGHRGALAASAAGNGSAPAATHAEAAASSPRADLGIEAGGGTSGTADTRISSTRIDRLAASRPLPWFERYAIDTVPPPYRGQRREVYPASTQKSALVAYLMRHLASGGELFQKLLQDDGEDASHYPFLRLYLSVMDLPARVFLDTIHLVFHEFALPRGRLTWGGVAV